MKKDGDFSFTQSGWGQGIDPYQFSVPVGNAWSADIFHTVLDRPLFRAGETVSMKHFLRRHQSSGIALQPDMPVTRKLVIAHQGSGQRYELPLSFGTDGVAESQWRIPAEAKLGDYRITLTDESGNERESGRFKVEQFRLPSMRGSVEGPALPVVRPQQVSLNVHVGYLSGGGAGGLPVKVRSLVEPVPQNFPGYEDYSFGGKPVKEGVVEGGPMSGDYDFEAGPAPETSRAQETAVTLDAAGSARVTLAHLPAVEVPSRLTAEVEYADANGEILTSTGRVQLVPAALTLGIRSEGWAGSSEQLRFRVLALDLAGKPRADQALNVALYQSSSFSYRKRLIGGFYAYETTTETRRLEPRCAGRTNAQGLLMCEVAPGVSGEVLLRAEGMDAQGALAGATASVWVAGKDDWWFGGTSGDRMDVLPEKKEYEAGETARLQVRMPFRAATALVSVQREGVLRSFVVPLKGTAPTIEVPIQPADAPNVYVSVLAVRGRVAHPDNPKVPRGEDITALVDLDKPAYKLGIARLKVGWKPHRLDVAVNTDRPTYAVRAPAHVRIHVSRADGGALPAGAEVALAAVDEALLDLAPNPSWDLLAAMMGERGLEVYTSTAQMQVVGKRHYGRKAVTHGGGGGRERDRARDQFDSLLRWTARVRLDAGGNAELDVPMNDSLSSFRIVAVAHAGAQFFGTGKAVVNTTQDLILLSGLPPLVREGDRFAATFTVRNTTDHLMRVEATAEPGAPGVGTPAGAPAGAPDGAPDGAPVGVPAGVPAAQRFELAAGQAHDVSWPVATPVGVSALPWRVSVRDLAGTARDQIKVTQQVIPAFPVRTYQATIAQLTSPLSMPAQRPKGAVPGRGGIEVTLRAKLGDGLDGVREYMSRYPYSCFEQQASRAMALRDRARWDALMERLPAYLDRDGLIKYFPTDWIEGDDALSAYILAIASEGGYEVPEAERQRIILALQRFVAGKLLRRSALPTADLSIRKLAAIEALSRHGAAQPGMLDSISIDPNLWPTSAVIDWLGILDRVKGVKQAAARREAALTILRSRLNFQGTIMTFSSERRDSLWWLMISGDSNANRMLLAVLGESGWREDIPRLVRGALGRQQYGHWNTTVANVWGVLAMEKFSRSFESVPVSGATGVRYADQRPVVKWPQPKGEAQLTLPWAQGQSSLGIAHIGGGAPWAMVRATAALPLEAPLFTGFKVTRTVSPLEQQRVGSFTRGDVVRVHLDLEAQSDMSWVVVDDPIPAGATVLGSGLGGQSELSQRGERAEGWAWPAFEERRFDGYRGYYRFVPKGRWSVEYTVRLNNPGTFQLPATRVEAMYAPEMFAEVPNAMVTVDAAPPAP
ncbi:MAG: MG2 domain-containing protein [Steroidobacteraceae bacterium]